MVKRYVKFLAPFLVLLQKGLRETEATIMRFSGRHLLTIFAKKPTKGVRLGSKYTNDVQTFERKTR